MQEIQITARFRIHAGRLDDFHSLARECMDVVREHDTGTLQYDWFLHPDGTECVLRERYRDSDAVMEHMGNLGDRLGRFFEFCDVDIEVYGSPSDVLVQAAAALRPRVYPLFQGIENA